MGSNLQLRYCKSNDTHYIQIRGWRYRRVDKQYRKIGKRTEFSQGKNEERRQLLRQERTALEKQRAEKTRYVVIQKEDIPPGSHIRILVTPPDHPVPVSQETYRRLVERLRQRAGAVRDMEPPSVMEAGK